MLAWEANYHDRQSIELFLGDPDLRSYRRLGASSGGSSLTQGFRTQSGLGHVTSELAFAPPSVGWLVYTASNAQHDLDLLIEGHGPVAMARGADGGAAWSPDGRAIVFTSSRSGDGDLYLVQTAPGASTSTPWLDTPPVRLTAEESGAELYASWSHDSEQIVYVTRGPQGDHIWRVAREGGAPRQLTAWPGSQILPRYSPVDRMIAFYANRERKERFDLYLLSDTAGASPVLLASDVLPNSTGPAWTPDGRSVVYTARDDEAFNPICVVPIDYPAARQTLPLDTIGHGDIAVGGRPDGSVRVAYVAQGRAGEKNLSWKRLYVTELAPTGAFSPR
jgi:hypothetical protein